MDIVLRSLVAIVGAAAVAGQGRGLEPRSARCVTVATDAAFAGYTLLAPLRSKATVLLDMDGAVVHEWRSERPPGEAVYLLDDGSLLRAERDVDNPVFHAGGAGGFVVLTSWEGETLWELDWSSAEHQQHHDVEPLPNGNVLLIAWEARTREEAIAAGRDPARVGEAGLWPDYLVEVRPLPPDGCEVVWEWRVWDHLVQDFDPQAENFGDVAAHPELVDVNAGARRDPPTSALARRMEAIGYVAGSTDDTDADWLHTNSVDYEPHDDLVLLSVRSLSEIWVIDHSTTPSEAADHAGGRYGKGGDLLYRWGDPRRYRAGDASDRRLFAQHDASWVRAPGSDALRVLVFNNGVGRPGEPRSTVEELELPFETGSGFRRAPGAAFGPRAPAWTYGTRESERFSCAFLSGAQRLPNGNTLVCMGTAGRLVELTPERAVAWELSGPCHAGGAPGAALIRGDLFRATRLASDHPGLVGRELEPR